MTGTFKGPGPATGQTEGMLSRFSGTAESGKSKLSNFGIQSVLKSDSADLEKGKDGSNSDKIVSSLSKSVCLKVASKARQPGLVSDELVSVRWFLTSLSILNWLHI